MCVQVLAGIVIQEFQVELLQKLCSEQNTEEAHLIAHHPL